MELKNDVVFTGENEISFEDGSSSLQPMFMICHCC